MPRNFNDSDDDYYFPHKDRHKYINNKIVLIAFLSLFAIVVLVAALHAYVLCVLHRRARRRTVLHHLDLTMAYAYSVEQPKSGLEPSVIASLPIFAYKTNINEYDDYDESTEECTVCLSSLEDEEMAKLLPNCNHFFHVECVDRWLISHSTCPICRTEAKPCLHAEPREGHWSA